MHLSRKNRFLMGGRIHSPLVEKLGFEQISSAASTPPFNFPTAPLLPYIFFLLKGQLHWRIGEAGTVVQPGGTVLIVGPDTFSRPFALRKPPGFWFWMALKKRPTVGVDALLRPKTLSRVYGRLLGCAGRPIRLSAWVLSNLERLAEEIDSFPVEDRALLEAGINLLTAELLLELARIAASEERVIQDKVVAAGIKYVEEHYGEKITTAMLTKYLGYSATCIRTNFERVVGMPPHQYQLRYRVDRARALLLSGDKAITDVAFKCGFNSSQHLSTSFKKITGLTPTQFRKNAGADATGG